MGAHGLVEAAQLVCGAEMSTELQLSRTTALLSFVPSWLLMPLQQVPRVSSDPAAGLRLQLLCQTHKPSSRRLTTASPDPTSDSRPSTLCPV